MEDLCLGMHLGTEHHLSLVISNTVSAVNPLIKFNRIQSICFLNSIIKSFSEYLNLLLQISIQLRFKRPLPNKNCFMESYSSWYSSLYNVFILFEKQNKHNMLCFHREMGCYPVLFFGMYSPKINRENKTHIKNPACNTFMHAHTQRLKM